MVAMCRGSAVTKTRDGSKRSDAESTSSAGGITHCGCVIVGEVKHHKFWQRHAEELNREFCLSALMLTFRFYRKHGDQSFPMAHQDGVLCLDMLPPSLAVQDSSVAI